MIMRKRGGGGRKHGSGGTVDAADDLDEGVFVDKATRARRQREAELTTVTMDDFKKQIMEVSAPRRLSPHSSHRRDPCVCGPVNPEAISGTSSATPLVAVDRSALPRRVGCVWVRRREGAEFSRGVGADRSTSRTRRCCCGARARASSRIG